MLPISSGIPPVILLPRRDLHFHVKSHYLFEFYLPYKFLDELTCFGEGD